MIGTTEIILIAAVALLLFGGKKLPELMKGLGQGVRDFKKGLSEDVKPSADGDEKSHSERKQDTTAEQSAEPEK